MTFRITPNMPVQAYQTYGISQPLDSHFVQVDCGKARCDKLAKGWQTMLDVSNPEFAELANWVRLHSGRAFTYEQTGDLVTFTFPAGQQCFEPHFRPLDRPAYGYLRAGDWRGHDGSRYDFANLGDLVDSWANHQIKLSDKIDEG